MRPKRRLMGGRGSCDGCSAGMRAGRPGGGKVYQGREHRNPLKNQDVKTRASNHLLLMNSPPSDPNPTHAKSWPAPPTIVDRLRWNSTPELHETIRRLWIDHSKAEDSRDLNGLIATLAPDCVYEIVPTGQRWEGHEGARQFYTSFLGAFPDVKFNLTEIVIGPQGVFEAADN